MSFNFNIGDCLIRIKNSLLLQEDTVNVIKSKIICNILNILIEEGFITTFYINTLNKRLITIILKYDSFGKPLINKIHLLSKPGNRKYITYLQLKQLCKTTLHLNDIYILSTSLGLMCHTIALQKQLGGELICKIN